MALLAYPLESSFTGFDSYGNPVFDRAVSSAFYRGFWLKYFTDGIFYDPADNFTVSPAGGVNVRVKLGECHIRGVTAQPDDVTEQIIALEPASVSADRTDRIVIRADFENERLVCLAVRGDWKSSDSLVRNANIWELAIADVLIKRNATELQQSNITDLRLNTTLCGVVTEPIKRTNTQAFFEQLQSEMARVGTEWNVQKAAQQAAWQSQMSEQDSGQEALMNTIRSWYTDVHLDIARLQIFDYDNIAALPGVTRRTSFSGDTVTETIRVTSSGKLAAERVTVFSGTSAVIETTVYDTDGVSVISQTVNTCDFGEGIVETVVQS